MAMFSVHEPVLIFFICTAPAGQSFVSSLCQTTRQFKTASFVVKYMTYNTYK